jgi:SAM-dependent methyltransferase
MVDPKSRFFPESGFGGFTRADGTLAFYARVQALLNPEMVAIDFGCGRGAAQADPLPYRREQRILKGKVRQVIGLDVSPAGFENPWLDQFYRLDGLTWPLPDESANLVLCDQVLEHLPDPPAFFAEARRVLAPGGLLCIRTPNRWSYIALLARLVPNRAHVDVLQRVKPGTPPEDVFPTLYRCNTLPALRAAFQSCGFEHAVYGFAPEPGYLSFSNLTYALGLAHNRLAPDLLKPVLFGFGRKRA